MTIKSASARSGTRSSGKVTVPDILTPARRAPRAKPLGDRGRGVQPPPRRERVETREPIAKSLDAVVHRERRHRVGELRRGEIRHLQPRSWPVTSTLSTVGGPW